MTISSVILPSKGSSQIRRGKWRTIIVLPQSQNQIYYYKQDENGKLNQNDMDLIPI